ncbi:MAG: OmpA family protein [Planctomycetota bacterium]
MPGDADHHDSPTLFEDEASKGERLNELRNLLIAGDFSRLNELQRTVDDPVAFSRLLAEALPKAIAVADREGDLGPALSPVVTESIHAAVKRDPKPLADALFPVIGPAIRKATSEALARVVESVNASVSAGLSPRTIGWRFEAWRTGRSFAEVVLAHTLVYKVTEVFLIHKETGLLLAHTASDSSVARDPDMVGGMLTAITDFVRDSFGAEQGDTIDSMKVGERSVWIESGPHAVVAAVIRGQAPQELRERLRHAAETIHARYADELTRFDGDVSVFSSCIVYLDRCLDEQRREDQKSLRLPVVHVAVLAIVIVLALYAWWRLDERTRFNALVNTLRAEPGVLIVERSNRGWTFVIEGIRDPLSTLPEDIRASMDDPPGRLEMSWRLAQTDEPAFIERRARAMLDAPATVALRYESASLVATGSAPRDWTQDATRLARFIPGVESFDASGVVDADVRRLSEYAARVESRAPLFERDAAEFTQAGRVEADRLAEEARLLLELARRARYDVRFVVIGHTDNRDTDANNRILGGERAAAMLRRLIDVGVPTDRIRVESAGESEPRTAGDDEVSHALNRRVEVMVRLTDLLPGLDG